MRLTNHDPGYQPYVISANKPTWRAIYDKLCEYEDAEEQGRLVILPCKVGDTLYALTRNIISEFRVSQFDFGGYDKPYLWVEWYLIKGITGNFRTDGTRNACSFLYSAAAREAKRRGYEKIITYILQSDNGASLRASNWTLEAAKCGKPSWDGPRYRARHEQEQLTLFPKKIPPPEYKQRWVRRLKEG